MSPTPTTTVDGPERVAVELDEDAADLEVTVDEVVRPLELDAGETLALQRADDGDADRERRGRP